MNHYRYSVLVETPKDILKTFFVNLAIIIDACIKGGIPSHHHETIDGKFWLDGSWNTSKA